MPIPFAHRWTTRLIKPALLFLLFTLTWSFANAQQLKASNDFGYSFDVEKTKIIKGLEKALKDPSAVVALKLKYNTAADYTAEFEQLNNALPQFEHLKWLNIDIQDNPNSLEHLPDQLFNCAQLEHLAIWGLQDISPETQARFSALTNLRFLSISSLNLNEVPLSICALHQLRALELYFSRINTIPDELLQLKNLTTLNLGNNCFRTFPEKLNQLPALQYLYLYNPESPRTSSEVFSDKTDMFCYNKFDAISLKGFKTLKELQLNTAISFELKESVAISYPAIKIR